MKMRFYFADKPDHKQIEIFNPWSQSRIPVDHRMAEILKCLWRVAIPTEASCQGSIRARNQRLSCNHAYIS
jgi:hypothetical protein